MKGKSASEASKRYAPFRRDVTNTFRDGITADGGDNGGELAAQKCGPFGLVKSHPIFGSVRVLQIPLYLITFVSSDEKCRAPGKEKSRSQFLGR